MFKVVIRATISTDQSERSKNQNRAFRSVDQIDVTNAHIWSWLSTWPHGIKNTRTQGLDPHSLHSFNEKRAWIYKRDVCDARVTSRPFFTNLTGGRVRPQSSRSHRDNWIGWLHQWRACQTPTHTASRAEPLEFVSALNLVWNNRGW